MLLLACSCAFGAVTQSDFLSLNANGGTFVDGGNTTSVSAGSVGTSYPANGSTVGQKYYWVVPDAGGHPGCYILNWGGPSVGWQTVRYLLFSNVTSAAPTVIPSDDHQAFIVHGSVGSLPSGVRAFVKYKFTDVPGDATIVEANPDGTFNISLTGADSLRPYDVEIGYYKADKNGELTLLYKVGADGQLPTYDGETGTSQTLTPSYETPTFQEADLGIVTHADGSTESIQTLRVSGGGSGSGNGTVTINSGTSDSGGRTIFIQGGVTGTGEGGSFVSSNASSDSADLAEIKNLIRENNLLTTQAMAETSEGFEKLAKALDGINDSLKPTPTPIPSPTPTPTPEPEEESLAVNSTFNPTGITPMTPPTWTNPSQPVSWTIKFPGSNIQWDLAPEHQDWFVQFCAWLKIVIWWLLTIWITWHTYNRINQLVRDIMNQLEAADIARMSHGGNDGKNKYGKFLMQAWTMNTGWYSWGILKNAAANAIWKVAAGAAVVIFIGLVGGQFLTAGGLANWFLGGSNLFQSLATAILPTYAPLQASVFYLCMCVPMDHALLVGSIWFAEEAVAGLINWLFGWFCRFTS